MENIIREDDGQLSLIDMAERLSNVFMKNVVFKVDADRDIYDIFLENIDENREEHECSKCRKFFNQYGPLVSMNLYDETYHTISCLFGFNGDFANFVPEKYKKAIIVVRDYIQSSPIRTIYSDDTFISRKIGGLNRVGGEQDGYPHFSAMVNKQIKDDRRRKLTLSYKLFKEAMTEYSASSINIAVELYRNERVRSDYTSCICRIKDHKDACSNITDPRIFDNFCWFYSYYNLMEVSRVKLTLLGTMLGKITEYEKRYTGEEFWSHVYEAADELNTTDNVVETLYNFYKVT